MHAALPVLGIGSVGRTDLFEQSSPDATPGLFIDLDNPATCSGVITEWNVCYYNPRRFNFEDRLQITLQIWRFEEQVGTQLATQVATVTVPEEPETFQCITIPLGQDEYMNITEGDVIGVLLTRDAVLPVVANFNQQVQGGETPPRLLFFQANLTMVTFQANNFIFPQVLHVTAEIGERMITRSYSDDFN